MVKKRLLLFFMVLLAGFALKAQHVCYSTEVIQHRRANDPAYDQAVRDAESAQQKWVQSGQRDPYFSARAVRTIPVVVHVVYNNSAQNVSDAAILQMISQLNADYRKQNADLASARSVVQPIATDAQIEFCLAQRTPSGQATTGIDRVPTTHGCFDADTEPDAMKSSNTGGVNAWNPSKYLNIWIVPICGSSPQTGGVAGYSYIPTSNNGLHGSSVDGVVVDCSIGLGVGNRTWTHEVGHYLGLHHVWGDLSGNACGNTFPDTDDGFSDTPDSKGPNFSCTPHASCTNNSSYGDQFENFMDYSTCTVLFTTQQANYMNSILTNVRSSLFNNNPACTPLNGPTASFTATPTSLCVGGTVQFTSTSTGNNLTYSWSFPGGTPSSSTAQNPAVVYAAAGTYNVSLTVSSGGQNNTATENNYIVVSSNSALPLSEGFQSATFPPAGWSLINPDNNTTWTRTTSAGGYGNSNASAYVNNNSYSSVGQKDWLLTPPFSFSGVGNGRIKWDYAYAQYPGYSDSFEIMYSVNCGATWTSLWKKGGASLATAPATNANFVPSAAQWKTDSISLSSLSGQTSVRFAFVNINRYGNNFFLDNVNVYNASATQTQAPVADFLGTPTTVAVGNNVLFTDLSANNPTSWSWTFSGGTPASSTAQNPTVTYNTVGVYPVTLTASNSAGNNTKTKQSYITVVQGGGTSSCDTLTNLVTQDTLTVYSFLNNGGYLAGHNQYADKAKAEYFVNPSPGAQLGGAFFYFGLAKTTAPATAHITATVWDNTGTGGSPGNVLATQNVLINSIAQDVVNQDLTYVNFAVPAVVNTNFYLGFQMTNAPGDTVALWTTMFSSPSPNGAWEQESDSQWYLFDSVYGAGLDLAVFPILCTSQVSAPTASFSSNKTAVCAGSSVSFTSTSTGNPTSFSWTFQGGTPATSSSANPTVVYNTPGVYNVSLTAANSGGSNSSSQTGYITVYANPNLSLTTVPVKCFGGSNGSATVSATGGTAPYTYAWSGGGNTATISNKQAGTYTVTVTDVHQCSATTTAGITQPLAPLSVMPQANDATCNTSNGSASVTAGGGAGAYTYLWNNQATTSSINNLAPGNYSVTVTDANNCSASVNMAVSNQNLPVNISLNVTAACSGSNTGTAEAEVINSLETVDSYHWNTGSASGSINNLAPGTYSVTVTLSNGCSGTATGQVIAASAPTASATPVDGSCQSIAAVNLAVSGGTVPYTYSWSNGASTQNISNIATGLYAVTVTDANGCSTSATASVVDNSALSVTLHPQNPVSGNDGSVTAVVSGGSAPYTYAWSNGDSAATIGQLAAGVYTVTVTDKNGCIKSAGVTLVITGVATWSNSAVIHVYPNPAHTVCRVQIDLSQTATLQIEVLNSLGQSLFATQQQEWHSGTETIDMSLFAQGLYLVKIRIDNTEHLVRLLKQ